MISSIPSLFFKTCHLTRPGCIGFPTLSSNTDGAGRGHRAFLPFITESIEDAGAP